MANCDGCTLCCKLLNIPWMESPAGEYCKECEPGKGCKIYYNAPPKCLKFNCAYAQMNKVSTNLRPDNCGVMFERIEGDIFVGNVDPDREMSQEMIDGQINAFLNEGFSVVLFNKKIATPFIIPAKGQSTQEIYNRIKEEASKFNGSS